MKWAIDYGDRDWHPWFAWYPVSLSHKQRGTRVWFEWIERKTENCQGWLCHHYRMKP